MQLTFVTAVGPYHAHLIPAIQAQGTAQTVPCLHVIIHDTRGRGAGWARNRGLDAVTTPYVAFLDADDQIAPTWAAETLAAFDGRYVYTDHLQDGRVIEAPDRAWVNRTWHVITALIPTAWARAVGGFDETLPAFEDTAFYLALQAHGYCGRRLARPLFTYGAGGQRSKAYHATPVEDAVRRYFTRQYGGRTMACCGDVTPNIPPSGDQQAGDILAQAIYAGNRREWGRVTGRLYPRTGNGGKLWMDARDVAASPALWRAVSTPEASTVAPDFDFASFADYAAQTGDNGGPLVGIEAISDFIMRETTPPAEYVPPPVAISADPAPTSDKPSASAIREKAARGRKPGRRQPARAVEAAQGAAR